jgi:predicted transcriptional regulator
MLTPTLPCKDCMRLNMKAEGAPERPRCKMPDKDSSPNSQEVKEWEEWDNKIQKVLGITETAVLFYEARKVGMTKAKKQRKERNKNHKNRIKTLNKIDRLTKACEKLYADGRISKLNETLKEIEDLTNSLNSDIIV